MVELGPGKNWVGINLHHLMLGNFKTKNHFLAIYFKSKKFNKQKQSVTWKIPNFTYESETEELRAALLNFGVDTKSFVVERSNRQDTFYTK